MRINTYPLSRRKLTVIYLLRDVQLKVYHVIEFGIISVYRGDLSEIDRRDAYIEYNGSSHTSSTASPISQGSGTPTSEAHGTCRQAGAAIYDTWRQPRETKNAAVSVCILLGFRSWASR